MKVGAHPLVVAVALGMLGPGVLSEVEEARGCERPRERCPCDPPGADGAACEAPDEADPLDVREGPSPWAAPSPGRVV